MPREMTVQDSIVIEGVAPTAAYDEIADVAQMGRWSPENLGAEVGDVDGPPYVGMTFVGQNRRGRLAWATRCTVTAADPGERFAFRVHAIGRRVPLVSAPIASWEYRFEPAGAGTRVTETWTDRRRGWPDFAAARFDKLATGGNLFSDFQRRNIARTLAALKTELETPQS